MTLPHFYTQCAYYHSDIAHILVFKPRYRSQSIPYEPYILILYQENEDYNRVRNLLNNW